MSAAATHKFTNRLIDETSPYLLQHAHNPVDWHPWGPEAFELARREDKPIFLSVGYSTCYWCHVMERQSFENEAIAAEMNKLFVNIKVDREERPDVDQLYMTAVQVLTRQGGWPMSVFLTPDLEPFYGGTYFPPTDAHGRPGFSTLIRALEEAYRERPADVRKSTTQLVNVLGQLAEPARANRTLAMDAAWVEALLDRTTADYDPAHGGFGRAPKFPRETELELILAHNALAPNEARMEQLAHTLNAMADGGIRDQLGGGFHRYSTDAHWLVPHFEIMLYDNAMLGLVYAEASRQLAEPRHAKVAHGIFDFVLREMTSPSGAFYTAFDAEVDAKEGDNYVWTAAEADHILRAKRAAADEIPAGAEFPLAKAHGPFTDEDVRLFFKVYGLDRGPNFADPHHGTGSPDKNILFLPNALDNVAASIGATADEVDARLQPMRQALYAARALRKQPLLDTKILTSWNALMIRALAHGGLILNEPRYVEAAARGAKFLLDNHRDGEGFLKRTSRDGSPAKFDAFLDDYAFLAEALLALHAAQPDAGWKLQAERVVDALHRAFASPSGAFFYTAAGAKDLIVRQIVGTDSPLPSGNGVAARVLLALGRADAAREVLSAFAKSLQDQAEGMSTLLHAAALYVDRVGPLLASASSAARPESPWQVADQIVTVRTRWESPRVLLAELAIAAGYHVNANAVGRGLIPTSITVAGATVEYPPALERQFEFAEESLAVYEGTTTIRAVFDAAPTGPVSVIVVYQPCDDGTCLAPVRKTIQVAP